MSKAEWNVERLADERDQARRDYESLASMYRKALVAWSEQIVEAKTDAARWKLAATATASGDIECECGRTWHLVAHRGALTIIEREKKP